MPSRCSWLEAKTTSGTRGRLLTWNSPDPSGPLTPDELHLQSGGRRRSTTCVVCASCDAFARWRAASAPEAVTGRGARRARAKRPCTAARWFGPKRRRRGDGLGSSGLDHALACCRLLARSRDRKRAYASVAAHAMRARCSLILMPPVLRATTVGALHLV